MSQKTYNLYCDESCHLPNDSNGYMIMSYVSVPYNQMNIVKRAILDLKARHGIRPEFKWTKISGNKEQFYLDLIDLFFSTELKFRAIVIKKHQIDDKYFGKDFNDFYFRMYYQLLYHKINMECNYNIYLDIKDTLSAHKVVKLKEILKIDYTSIRNIQNIHSHESVFMQLTDVLMGAISYQLNNVNKRVKAKNRVIQRIEKLSQLPIAEPTHRSEEKFNKFFIELQ